MEIKNNSNVLEILSNNTTIFFDNKTKNIKIEDLEVSFPGEYEKGGILLEVKEFEQNLFYKFSLEGKNLVIILADNFEQKEEILSFFGDVDVLILVGSKDSVKIFENIEARIVIPFGEGKDVFLNTLGQHSEEQDVFKLKGELPTEETEFVNLS